MTIKVCLGGTFNVIHEGHISLLKKAFEVGDHVYIGLTTDEMASRYRDVPLQDYNTRLQNLNNKISQIAKGKQYFVFPLEDAMGPAIRENYDIIVVSQDTVRGAEKINATRERNGLKALKIVVIKMVLADDKKPISASRIVRGQIKPDGSKKQ